MSRPSTPTSNVRNRSLQGPRIAGQFASDVNTSPTLSSLTDSSGSGASPTTPSRLNDSTSRILAATSALRPSQIVQPARRRFVIRSDPALLTCFDPIADKELYELWAPKR